MEAILDDTGEMLERYNAVRNWLKAAAKKVVGVDFFFSSRRRHTRYWRDWSSDVCSSDLADAVHRAHGGRADVDRPRQGSRRARRDVVVVGGLHLAGERRRPGRGLGADRVLRDRKSVV